MKPVRIEIAAAILGVSRVAIIKARKLGTFPGSGSEPVDLEAVPASDWGTRRGVTIESIRRAILERDGAPAAPKKRATRARTAQPTEAPSSSGKLQQLAKVDVDKLVGLERREKLRLQNESYKGKLVSREEVEENWADIAVRIQNGVMGIAARVANRIPAEWRIEVMRVVLDESRQLLKSLANEIGSHPEAA